jgi:hypothetical protein
MPQSLALAANSDTSDTKGQVAGLLPPLAVLETPSRRLGVPRSLSASSGVPTLRCEPPPAA